MKDVDIVEVGNSLNLIATATDNVGVVKIEAFFGDEIIGLDQSGSAPIIPEDSGRITVKAYDLQETLELLIRI